MNPTSLADFQAVQAFRGAALPADNSDDAPRRTTNEVLALTTRELLPPAGAAPELVQTLSFLRTVLPAEGVKVLAEIAPGQGVIHHFDGTHEATAARAIELDDAGKNVYFACATFKTKGSRKAENAHHVKAFWIDADVERDNPAKYPSQREAVNDVARVCKELGLPLPLIVKSGNGVHAYWPLTAEIDAAAWRPIALRLKAALTSLAFRQDRTRTADVASILRPVGTHWRKSGVRLVTCAHEGTPLPVDAFVEALTRFEERQQPLAMAQPPAPLLAELCANDDLVRGVISNPQEPYPYAENRENFRAALHAAIPTPHDRADWRTGELALAYLVVQHGWPEGNAKALLDEWSRLAEGADTSNNDADWLDALKRTRAHRASGSKSMTTHLSILKRARDRGWAPTAPPLQPPPQEPWLEDLNARFAWIEETAAIYREEFSDYIDPTRFKTQEDIKLVAIANGAGTRSIGAGSAWLRHGRRRQHKRVVIRPEEPKVTQDNCLNQWQGFSVPRLRGDVKPFVQLFRRLLPDTDVRRYVIRWMAHLIQRPGVKMHVAVVLWSIEQGVGKNLLFECLAGIIGPAHAAVIGQRDLAGHFNASWARLSIFVIGNEISSTTKRQDADALKGLLTDSELWIEAKYQPAYRIPNRLNFVFLSNHPDAVFVEDHDRRFFVCEVTAPKLLPVEAREFVRWRDGGGLAALHDFLARMDLSDFDPKAAAPMTAAKREMIEDSRSDLERWLTDVMKGNVAEQFGRDLATSAELARRYANETGRREPPSTKAVTTAAKKLGALARPSQVRLANGKKVRALALARQATWRDAAEAEWAAELDKPCRVN